MTSGTTRAVSIQVLAALTAAVLLVHLALLQDVAVTVITAQREAPPVFSTRSLSPAAPSPTPAERTPPPTPPARPRAKRPPIAVAARAQPAVLPARTGEESATPAATSMLEAEQQGLVAPSAPLAAASEAASAQQKPSPEDEALSAPARPPREQLGTAHVYKVPGSMRLKYEVKGNKFPYSLNSELRWQQDGENYDAQVTFSAAFLPVISQTSRGQITALGLAPIRFGDKRRSEVAAHFVREQGKITFSANTPDAPLLSGAQDRLSLLLQLAAMIAGDPGAYPVATTITMQVVGPRAADIWLFTVDSEETLTLPGGERRSLKLQRNPREPYDQKIELWLAPALGYLPVRVRISESNGDFVDQKWLSSEPAP